MAIQNPEGPDEWARLMLIYNAALKKVSTKIEILNDEFIQVHHYNPIEHVKSRIKTAESIVKKLKRSGLEVSMENMRRYINDIAGIRIICSFTSDIYLLADSISNQEDIKVLTIKNYIMNPKSNGYQSYHLIISTPVYLSDGPVDTKVEIQIRTIAMDFWASLEHKIRYKFEGQAPVYFEEQLKACADIVDKLDMRMEKLNQEIQNYAGVSKEENMDERQKSNEEMQEQYNKQLEKRLREHTSATRVDVGIDTDEQ